MKTAAIFFALWLSLVIGQEYRAPPRWSDTYEIKGVLHVPLAKVEEPFHTWYDGPNGKSRTDFYGEMVKTYQRPRIGPYGMTVKIVPVTTEQVSNQEQCLMVFGTDRHPIQFSQLPNLTDYVYMGEDNCYGTETEKWQMNETYGKLTSRNTMWIRYDTDIKDSSKRIAIPVKHSTKTYNNLLGSCTDYLHLEYQTYDDSPIDEHIFQIPDMDCKLIAQLPAEYMHSFNPMTEFTHPTTANHVDIEFEKFQRKHGKQYASEDHAEERKSVFRQNLRFINSVNRQNRGYTLAVNRFADMNDLEFNEYLGRMSTEKYNGGQEFPYKNITEDDFPSQFDWRLYGAVTPVKDQSECASCWAFSAIGAIEGANFLKNRSHLLRLSEQALIDCSWGYSNLGCDGGRESRAFQWVMKHGGVPTEADYGPYLNQDGYCHVDKVPKFAQITGFVNVTYNDKNALRFAIFKHGPVSVGINTSPASFQFYSNGVYYEPGCNSTHITHAVLAVGYGTIKGEDYWLIKNSWNYQWGNDGYMLISARDNNCGVMTNAMYVTT